MPAGRKDTAQTLPVRGADECYGRLAAWMVEADAGEIAAYWQRFRLEKEPENDLADLIFLAWTRLDPRGAIIAARGTPFESHPWWAWACHDPTAALASVVAEAPQWVRNVTWSIGEFHPAWLRAHFDDLPEDGRESALRGYAKWPETAETAASVEFMATRNHLSGYCLQSLVRHDPRAVWRWCRESRSAIGREAEILGQIAAFRPEVLSEFKGSDVSESMRSYIDTLLFTQRLETDLDGAIEEAQAIKDTKEACIRLAQAGERLAATDPGRAFGLAPRMLEMELSLSEPGFWSPENFKITSSRSGYTDSFLLGLVARDPERLMNMAQGDTVACAADAWAKWDVGGLSDWVNRQEAGPARDAAAMRVASAWFHRERYPEALAWGLSLSHPDLESADQIFSRWTAEDPEAARRWVEETNLSEETREVFTKRLSDPPP